MEPTIRNKQNGFAMLFTVLIVSLILSIAVSISNVTLKQGVLSNLVKDSQIAFYQSDSGIECGSMYDITHGIFPPGATVDDVPETLYCGNSFMIRDDRESTTNYFRYYQKVDQREPCFEIFFDKRDLDGSGTSIIQSYGYNICDAHPRQVERALELRY